MSEVASAPPSDRVASPREANPVDRVPVLDVRGLRTEFSTDDGTVHALNGVSLQLHAGETLALVGESGSGKSVAMLSVMGLIPNPPGRIIAGEVWFHGRDLLTLDKQKMREIRGRRISMIFQEPVTSLDPVFTVGSQITEALQAHLPVSKKAARERGLELLRKVNIAGADRVIDAYPHQLSGGMCQRVMLAIALACEPEILIADEPTTALDITTQAQLLDLVRSLQAQLGMAVIWVTHDLGIVAGLANRVAVMYAGRIVEEGPVESVYADPQHPYTRGLLTSIPRLDVDRTDRMSFIPGAPPNMLRSQAGCPFAPRCVFRVERCAAEDPPLEAISEQPGHSRACWVDAEIVRGAAS
jgi:oligopeptide/dipeptide ABC transporter ATP-binding protein